MKNGCPTTATGKAGMNELASFWAKTFAPTTPDHEAVNTFLSQWGQKLDISTLSVPSSADVATVMDHLPHSAPGPDGIPYGAWKAGGQAAATTLHQVV